MATEVKVLWTETAFILDRSGSMDKVLEPTIKGFNDYLAEQKTVENASITITLIQFDDKYEVNYESKNVKEVEDLTTSTYVPRGMTALYDTIGKAITDTSDRYKKLTIKPDKTVFVIITDGANNICEKWTKISVKAEILKRQAEDKWSFVFLGANIDAFAEAGSLGIAVGNTQSYEANEKGVTESFRSISRGMVNYSASMDCNVTSSFFDGDINKNIAHNATLKMQIKK